MKVLLFFLCFWVRAALAFPELSGQVVDDAGILNAAEKGRLQKMLSEPAKAQVVVATLASLEGKEIEEYGYQLGRYWGIGEKGKDNGVLILLAPNERQMRIEVGYGMEGVLTDALSSQIIQTRMIPLAREGDYAGALLSGTKAVLEVIDTGEMPYIKLGASNEELSPEVIVVFIVIILLWGFILTPLVLTISLLFVKNQAYRKKVKKILKWYKRVTLFSGGSLQISGFSKRGGSFHGGSGFRGGGGSFGGGGSSGRW